MRRATLVALSGKRRAPGCFAGALRLAADIRTVLPPEVARSLVRALPILERRFPGFAGSQGIITAPETRASSPIRMVRDEESRMSTSVADLYPIGEGAGYAGGILSAAVDGLHTADAIIGRFSRP